ncbi:MAG: DsbA family protein [Desulfovibrio sp.]|nr:DsbA family protein [Desulfovibrio sp.]
MNETHFVYIADVYCPWCYAFAPIMQRLAAEHPDIPVHVLGGNLISEAITLKEDAANSPGLTDFWREVEHTSGRSLAGAISAVEQGRDIRMSSPGADLVLTALKTLAPGHELDQMVALEDVFYGQGQDLFTDETIAALARRWGIAPDALMDAVQSQPVEEAAQQAHARAAALMGEIGAYPSVFLVRGNKRDAVSRGYVHYETVAARLEDAMRDLGVDMEPGESCSWHGGCTVGRHRR